MRRILSMALPILVSSQAAALAERGQLNALAFAVYAPQWTWQQCDINVLVVLTNRDSRPAHVEVTLVFPQDKEEHFDYPGDKPRTISVSVPSGQTIRRAFAGIRPRNDPPPQEYAFKVSLRCSDKQVDVSYPVRTIRGEAFSGGRWVALGVPSGVAVAWCVAFLIAMKRWAIPGAWKMPGRPVDIPTSGEPWIDMAPK